MKPDKLAELLERAPASWSMGRRHYVLAALCLIGLFNHIDRQIITILIEPIKREFNASDTAMGALTGLVFAGFYLAASAPLARLADVGVRRTVIAVCLGFWSLMTALGGLAQSFTQLAITRVGVAIGEAGAGPSSISMISDLYPLGRRATMISLYIGVQAVGIGLGVFLGGWLSQTFDWRTAFLMVGVPGVLLALLVMLTVKEPPRGMSDRHVAPEHAKPPLAEVARKLWSMKSYRFCLLTATLASLPGYGTLGWGPSMFMRVHGLSPTTTGFGFGAVAAASLFVGALFSGMFVDRFGRSDLRVYLWLGAGGSLLSAPLGLAMVFAPSPGIGFLLLSLFQLAISVHNPPIATMIQTLAPPRMRGLASVIPSLLVVCVGVGLAPFLIGVLSDLFQPRFGRESLRYALAFIYLGALAAGACALVASLWVRQDVARTQEEAQAGA
jgi:MFS family permease